MSALRVDAPPPFRPHPRRTAFARAGRRRAPEPALVPVVSLKGSVRRKGFDRLAGVYQPLETLLFGKALEHARNAFLGRPLSPRPGSTQARGELKRILIIGEGDGRFLAELSRRYPGVQVDCIDESRAMLARAERRLQRLEPNAPAQVRFLRGDVRNLILPETAYDILVTHFFLDCFTETTLKTLLPRLAKSLKPGGRWLLADFHLPQGRFARLYRRGWLRVLYTFFRWQTGLEASHLVDPLPLLLSQGLTLTGAWRARGDFVRSLLLTNSPPLPYTQTLCGGRTGT